MRVRMLGLAAIAALGIAAGGCGGDDGGEAGAASGGGGGKDYKIGIVAFAAADQTSSQAIVGYENKAKELGYEVTKIDPQGQTDKAIGAMQNLVQKKVDLIMVTVFPSDSLTAGVRAAKAAGIPVVSLSGGVADGVQNSIDSGESAGEPIAKQLVEDTGGQGKLLALGYKSGLPCIGREKALDSAIGSTQIEETREEVPIPGQVEASTQFTQAWLAKNPSGSGELAVWGCFDDPSLGAVAAIKQAKRDDVKVYGINGQPGALKAVQDGDMDGTVWLDVVAAGELIANNTAKYIEAGVDAPQESTAVPQELVTQDNVEQFLKDHPDALKGL